ncbi:MAG: hypothetical protein C4K58_00830 [Flavobacteriaceae bacterium]|nr:MAG: hypothetical protein C4K58_00830 [Flavobacteriaceae bacterium]
MQKTFDLVAILEGVSYLLLLFVAVPIKYILKDASYVKMLGMPHGILFILYVVLAFVLKDKLGWSKPVFHSVLLASLLPFATFFIGKKYKG